VPATVIGLIIVVVAVLPGAAYTWALERQIGSWGQTLADRTLRFITVSLGFHLALAWLEYLIYRWALVEPLRHHRLEVGQFAAAWAGVALLVSVPALVGAVLGGLYASRVSRSGWQRIRRRLSPAGESKVLQVVLGRSPSPRAWDDFFSESPTCYLRIRTPDGTLIAGRFAARSYASGFPQDPDLLLEEAYGIDEETGELTDPLGYALYVPSSQLGWVEVVLPRREDNSDG